MFAYSKVLQRSILGVQFYLLNNELDFLEMLLASALLPAAIAETTQQLRVHDILVTQFVHSGLLISNIVQKASVRRYIICSIEIFPLLLKIMHIYDYKKARTKILFIITHCVFLVSCRIQFGSK